MPQTLLALLALMLASLLTFNQQRLTARAQRTMVANEIELAAAGLASEVLEFIGARSFDETTTPEAIGTNGGTVPESPVGFSGNAEFGTLGGCDLLQPSATPSCNDIDDLDGLDWTPVDVELAHGRSLTFEVRTDVFYVDSPTSMSPANTPTRHKRVVLDLRSDYVHQGEDGQLRVTRVFSYDPVKAAMDYENSDHYDADGSGSGGGTVIQN